MRASQKLSSQQQSTEQLQPVPQPPQPQSGRIMSNITVSSHSADSDNGAEVTGNIGGTGGRRGQASQRPHTRRMSRVALIVSASVSALALIAGMGTVFGAIPAPQWMLSHQYVAQQHVSVQQSVQTLVCPAQMALIDTASYGDEAFRSTSGNIATHIRAVGIGPVIAGHISELDGTGTVWDMKTGESNVQITQLEPKDSAKLFQAMLSTQKEGNGIVAGALSQATEGDLRGTSALTCDSAALDQQFIVPSTQTGYAQQLVVANTSSKATTVHITVHGTQHDKALGLSTDSAVTVNAQSQQVLNLSAAAAGQDALYVQVHSTIAPVAAHVRAVAMSGLTPKGSEQIPSLHTNSAHSVVLSGSVAGLSTTAQAYAEQSGTAAWYWISNDGEHKAKDIALTGGKVEVTDLGKAPDGAVGLELRSVNTLLTGAAVQTLDGNNQSDFMMLTPATVAPSSAIALPDHVHTTLSVVNNEDAQRTAQIQAYDDAGKQLQTKEITLGAHSGTAFESSDFGNNVALVILNYHADAAQGEESDSQGWGWAATVHSVDNGVANLAQFLANPLEPVWADVTLQYTPKVVS